MKLYFAKGTIAVAVAIALEEAGVAYEAVKVDFANAAQTKPDYLALNPKGRVPTLVPEGGAPMTETGALLEYIADTVPGANLRPTDPADAQHVRAVMFYLASTMHVAHAHKMRGSRWADRQESFDDMTAKVPQTMAACATFVETDCLRGDYVLGDTFSMADAYLFVLCNWLEGDGVNTADYPRIAAFLGRMNARQSVKTVREKGIL